VVNERAGLLSALPADYRDQLVAAGIIRPATEPEITPDPVTNM
jgi:hypothetical protein